MVTLASEILVSLTTIFVEFDIGMEILLFRLDSIFLAFAETGATKRSPNRLDVVIPLPSPLLVLLCVAHV